VPHNSKATYGGMVYSDTELMVVMTNLASGGVVAWRVLCLYRSGFEGSGVGATCLVIVRMSARELG
jgi:hypothetical protein